MQGYGFESCLEFIVSVNYYLNFLLKIYCLCLNNQYQYMSLGVILFLGWVFNIVLWMIDLLCNSKIRPKGSLSTMSTLKPRSPGTRAESFSSTFNHWTNVPVKSKIISITFSILSFFEGVITRKYVPFFVYLHRFTGFTWIHVDLHGFYVDLHWSHCLMWNLKSWQRFLKKMPSQAHSFSIISDETSLTMSLAHVFR